MAATGQDNAKTPYSNYGAWVDIAAPGGNSNVDNQILSNVPKTGGVLSRPSGYLAISGTSMACPYLAGAAAQILSRNSSDSVDQVTKILLQFVDRPNEASSYIGTGRIDVFKAVTTLAVNGAASIQVPNAFGIINGSNVNATIQGKAQAVNGSYKLNYGVGSYPAIWTTITSGIATIP